MANIIIIGAGPMGLSAAWYALCEGHTVTVVEAEKEPGGMAAHFDFGGLSMERFYHFCCRSDNHTLAMLNELGLEDAMKWRPTSMGYFTDGALHQFGDPLSLLNFSPLTVFDRLRYGLMAYMATQRTNWQALDSISAREWITKWCGESTYKKMWHPLLSLKFYDYTDDISAAWVWQRINRLGNSRSSLFQEELGYIDGGSQTLIDRLVTDIQSRGGKIVLDAAVDTITTLGEHVNGVKLVNGSFLDADIICSTIPLPHATRLLQGDLSPLQDAYKGFANVGCICVIHKLRRPVSQHFWINVSDPSMNIPGFVEFSNLRPLPYSVVYVPYYMPADMPKFSNTDEQFLEESFQYLQRVNPGLQQEDRVDGQVSRLRYAQPVCNVGFASRLPDARTSVENLWIADTSFYYPEDRGISESIRYARKLITEINSAAEDLDFGTATYQKAA